MRLLFGGESSSLHFGYYWHLTDTHRQDHQAHGRVLQTPFPSPHRVRERHRSWTARRHTATHARTTCGGGGSVLGVPASTTAHHACTIDIPTRLLTQEHSWHAVLVLSSSSSASREQSSISEAFVRIPETSSPIGERSKHGRVPTDETSTQSNNPAWLLQSFLGFRTISTTTTTFYLIISPPPGRPAPPSSTASPATAATRSTCLYYFPYRYWLET